MVPKNIPSILKHVTIAVYNKGFLTKNKDGFQQALLIARASLSRQGYLTPNSEAGSIEAIALTGKGMGRDDVHKRHSGPDSTFDGLYEQFISRQAGDQKQHHVTPEDAVKEAIDKAQTSLSEPAVEPLTAADRRAGASDSPDKQSRPSTSDGPRASKRKVNKSPGTRSKTKTNIPKKGRVR